MFLVSCPHCGGTVEILEINCQIFRHAVLKDPEGQQLNPHAPKDVCDYLFQTGKIYGCGKPFILKVKNNKWVAKICDYI